MNYTLHQLQVFVKVVQTKSITKAAEELHMTQPAVSIQLKNLQDQFEVALTEVIGRQLYVTQFGKEIHQMAIRILNEVQAIDYKTRAYKGQMAGRLTISVVSTGKYVMPYFLSDFLKEHEAVDLGMDVTNKSMVINNLQRNEVDFALVSVLPTGLNIESERLLENALYVVGNNQSKWKGTQVSKEELQVLPFIYREEGSGTRQIMEQYFLKRNIKLRKKMELTSNEAVKQAIIAGLGYSAMPLIGIRNELLKGDLKILPVQGFPIQSQWQLIWMKGKKLSPIAQAYLTHLKTNKAAILAHHFSWIEKVKV